jgi:hypothetical protein
MLLIPYVTTICNDNCSSKKLLLSSIIDSFGVKTKCDPPVEFCYSALGLYMTYTVNNTSGYLEQFVAALMVKMQMTSNLYFFSWNNGNAFYKIYQNK